MRNVDYYKRKKNPVPSVISSSLLPCS